MKVAIVSDTNNNYDGMRLLLDRLRAGGARWLFHCGGLGSVDMVELLKSWQLYIVRGKSERKWQAIEVALQKARLQASLPTQMTVTLADRRIALCRGDDMKLVNQWSRSGEFNYIFHGHGLRRRNEKQGQTRIIYPGALGGPRYERYSGCLLDLATDEVKFVELSK